MPQGALSYYDGGMLGLLINKLREGSNMGALAFQPPPEQPMAGWSGALADQYRAQALEAQKRQALQPLMENAADAASPMGMLGRIVYHGSPYLFRPEYRGNKLGAFRPMEHQYTGQGQAVWGDGAYVTDTMQNAAEYLRMAMFNHPQYRELGPDLPGYIYKVDMPDELVNRMMNFHQGYKEQGLTDRWAPIFKRLIDERQAMGYDQPAHLFKDMLADLHMNTPLPYSRKGMHPTEASQNLIQKMGIPGGFTPEEFGPFGYGKDIFKKAASSRLPRPDLTYEFTVFPDFADQLEIVGRKKYYRDDLKRLFE